MTLLQRNVFLQAILQGMAAVLSAQEFPPPGGKEPEPKRLPDGTLQSEAILKADHKKMLADVARLIELGREIEEDLSKHEHHVLSLGMVKRLEEIEKLAKKMRGRWAR